MTAEGTDDGGIAAAEILDAARSLGILSAGTSSAPRILATLCNPQISQAEVGKVIGQEPGLTARVLRVANSAFYGLSGAIGTIDRAVVVLGLDAVRGVAAAACLDRAVLRGNEASPIDMNAMLRHSVATAAAAESLATIRHPSLAPEAFIAGLLHDFGVMLQVRVSPSGVPAMIDASRASAGHDVRALEAAHMRLGHENCGGLVFEAWNLPVSLIETARHHHDPGHAPAEHRALASLVHLGNHLAIACGIGFAFEPAPEAPSELAMTLLGATAVDLEQIAASLPTRVVELQRALAGS